jgi:hypothetical protein
MISQETGDRHMASHRGELRNALKRHRSGSSIVVSLLEARERYRLRRMRWPPAPEKKSTMRAFLMRDLYLFAQFDKVPLPISR